MNTRNLRFASNRVRDILALFHEELDGLYGGSEVGVFLDMLFEAFLGWNKVRLLTSKETTVDQSDLLRFHWALEDLKKNRPIQHIIGYTDFCDCRIAVSPDVLIPRPETEEMVNWILSTFHFPLSTFHFLDLCTGSGCIAIALKKRFPAAEVTAVDVSEKALAMARENAQANDVNINFLQAGLLTFNFPACLQALSTAESNIISEKLSIFNFTKVAESLSRKKAERSEWSEWEWKDNTDASNVVDRCSISSP